MEKESNLLKYPSRKYVSLGPFCIPDFFNVLIRHGFSRHIEQFGVTFPGKSQNVEALTRTCNNTNNKKKSYLHLVWTDKIHT